MWCSNHQFMSVGDLLLKLIHHTQAKRFNPPPLIYSKYVNMCQKPGSKEVLRLTCDLFCRRNAFWVRSFFNHVENINEIYGEQNDNLCLSSKVT